MFPLPTMNGAARSIVVIVGLCRITSDWRSIGASARAYEWMPPSSAATRQTVVRAFIAAEYAGI